MHAPPRLALLLALLLLLLLAACGRDDGRDEDRGAAEAGDVAEAERYGGTLVIAVPSDVGDIGPLTTRGGQAALYLHQFVLFAPLIAYDSALRPVPRLARSWEVSADTTLLTFHLRDDVYWHDGVKTTAHDVKFSYDLARHPETGYFYSGMWARYGEAEAPDSFTFRVRMRPHAEFMDAWRVFTPVPRHLLAGVPPRELAAHPFGTRAPVGNGPFRFVARAPGQSWTFAANERWPRGLGGRPYVDRLVFRVIPEPATTLAELETGGVDVWIAPPPEYAGRLRASQRARLASFPDLFYEHLIWNHRRAPFGDARVRRALTLAIDREKLVGAVRGGLGTVANSTVPPVLWMHDARAGAELKHDTAAARRLLGEAGFADRDGDGVVEDAGGRPFRFTLSLPHGNRERRDAAQVVQGDLARVGVRADLREVEFNALMAAAMDPARRGFDAMLLGWKTEFRVDDSEVLACGRRDAPLAFAGYCNPRTDALLDSVLALADRRAARPVWERYQRQVAADQPFTLLYFAERLQGVSRRVRGAAPDARGDWVGVERWWLHPLQRQSP